MFNKSLKNTAEWAVEYALKSGATEAASYLANVKSLNLTLLNEKIEKLQESNQNSLSLDLYCNNKYSSHSTNDLREDSLKKFIEEAVKMTNFLAKDDARMLPDKSLYPGKDALNKELELYDASYDSIDFKDKFSFALKLFNSIKGKSDKIINVTSYYNDSMANAYRVHSNGFSGDIKRTMFSVYTSVSANDPNGGKPSSGEGCSARFMSDLLSPEIISESALKRTLGKIGQKKIDSGIYKMLVENRVGWGPTGTITRALGGRTLQQKNSYLEGMLGKKIASEKLTIIDDPFIKKGLASRLFDGEGIASQRKEIVKEGVLNAYYIDNYYGRKLNMSPYSGSSSNLLYAEGDKSFEKLIKMIDKGIYVTDFIGGNFNTTSGDFSNGIAGYYIEGGEIKFPVNEMNISGNAKELWASLLEVGNDSYQFSSNKTPSFLFDNVDFSGK